MTDLPPYKRDVNTVFQSYALFPHLDVYENVAFGLRRKKVDKGEIEHARAASDDARRPDRVRDAQAPADVGRPAAARRARPRPREPPQGPAPRRAARRPRPEAAQADAARAEADPAGGRHHVHLRDARPGRGHDDVGPPRGHASRQDRAARRSRRASTRTPRPSSWPGSWGPRTCSTATSKGATNGLTRSPRAPASSVRAKTARIPTRIGHGQGRGAPREDHDRPADDGTPAGRSNVVKGLLRMSTYIGVSHQYKVEGPGGIEHDRLRAEPRAAGSQPRPGQQVRLEWLPEHTFVVEPQQNRSQKRRTTNDRSPADIGPRAALRGMTMRRVSRRDLFKAGGVGVAALSLGAILAACGTGDSSGTGNGGRRGDRSTGARSRPARSTSRTGPSTSTRRR